MAIANDAQNDGEFPAMGGDGSGVREAVDAGLATGTGGPVHPGLAPAVTVLEAAGIPWAILRGSLDGSESEVDLLVGAAAAGQLRALLAPAGFYPVRSNIGAAMPPSPMTASSRSTA